MRDAFDVDEPARAQLVDVAQERGATEPEHQPGLAERRGPERLRVNRGVDRAQLAGGLIGRREPGRVGRIGLFDARALVEQSQALHQEELHRQLERDGVVRRRRVHAEIELALVRQEQVQQVGAGRGLEARPGLARGAIGAEHAARLGRLPRDDHPVVHEQPSALTVGSLDRHQRA